MTKFKNPWSKGGKQWNPKTLFSDAIDDRALTNDQMDDEGVDVTQIEFPTPGTRPSWEILLGNYPGPDISTVELYQKIGGFLAQFDTYQKLRDSAYVNSCAFRMSFGLNHAGMKLPKRKDPHDLVVKGDDGLYYWGRVRELYDVMRFDLFGPPDLEFSLPKAKVGETKIGPSDDQWQQLRNKRGIVTFHVSGWTNAFGHFTLWDGKDLIYVGADTSHNDPQSENYYFRMKYEIPVSEERTIVVQTDKISLWEFE